MTPEGPCRSDQGAPPIQDIGKGEVNALKPSNTSIAREQRWLCGWDRRLRSRSHDGLHGAERLCMTPKLGRVLRSKSGIERGRGED